MNMEVMDTSGALHAPTLHDPATEVLGKLYQATPSGSTYLRMQDHTVEYILLNDWLDLLQLLVSGNQATLHGSGLLLQGTQATHAEPLHPAHGKT
jgi:hypothetical protein